jgi:medium-chain acyl-[acyl-carrier-protein] hydrolase
MHYGSFSFRPSRPAAQRELCSWFPVVYSGPNISVRLFCFPYAGGGATLFRSWPGRLPSTVGVYPVQLPGREERVGECGFTNIQSLIANLIPAVSKYLDKPAAVFGHSMGGLIAFEFARVLSSSLGVPVKHLFVSGCPGPNAPRRFPTIYHLPDQELLRQVQQLEGISENVLNNPELTKLILPTLRADFELCETYQPCSSQTIDVPITVFGGIGDTRVPRIDLELWHKVTLRSCMIRMMPGNHFFIHAAAQSLLQAIAEVLAYS